MISPEAPIGSEDVVYGDAGPVPFTGPNAKEDRIASIERQVDAERKQLQLVVATESGQALLMRVLKQCGLHSHSTSCDKAAMAFAEGKRSIALWLLAEMYKLNPTTYPTMLLAHVERERKRIAGETAAAMNSR